METVRLFRPNIWFDVSAYCLVASGLINALNVQSLGRWIFFAALVTVVSQYLMALRMVRRATDAFGAWVIEIEVDEL